MARSRTAHGALHLAEWPERDQAAWRLDCTPVHPFDDDGPHYGVTLSTATLAILAKSYGRWLRFLQSQGCLDPAMSPLERVTRPRLVAYFLELRAAGNASATINGRFGQLKMAMKMLCPGQDVSFITQPYGLSVYEALPKIKRHLDVPDSRVLFQWGLDMMDGADLSHVWGRARYRDGLLVALLAARGRRRRSMMALRVGRELRRAGTCFRVELEPRQVKTGVADRFDLPDLLTHYMQRYLDHVRPALLQDARHDALWITKDGKPQTEAGMTVRMCRLTRRRFGISFGPHRFRHGIATTLALSEPSNPGLSAAVLGITAQVTSAHYIRAGQVEAAQEYADLVSQRRRKASRHVRQPSVSRYKL